MPWFAVLVYREVLEGSAEEPLQKYDYKMIDNLTSEDPGY